MEVTKLNFCIVHLETNFFDWGDISGSEALCCSEEKTAAFLLEKSRIPGVRAGFVGFRYSSDYWLV
jgi:hypothetical protein